ncbi:MAG: hypothetical protein VZR22_08440 [Candidatus Cryptobacteroides sp.]|nr:hypothetical protein [Candidatus Cryptobacteroides sp.]
MGSSRILLMAAFLVLCLPTGARDRKGGRVIRYDDSARPVIASRGQWAVGGNAAISAHNNDNYTFAVIKQINSSGINVSAAPEACYFLMDNLGVGARFRYGRQLLNLGNASANLGSLSLEVKDYNTLSQDFSLDLFVRYYIPVGNSKRVAFHVDAGLRGKLGQARYSDGHTGETVGSWEQNGSIGLVVQPGITAKIRPRFALYASVGMAGASYGRKNQVHNQVSTGGASNFSISYMLDLTALKIGFLFFIGK